MTDQDEVLREFLKESYKGLDLVERDLCSLGAGSMDPESAGRLYRVFHTLKGTAGMLGFPRVQQLAQGGETLFLHVRDGQSSWDGSQAGVVRNLTEKLEDALTRIRATRSDEGVDTGLPEGMAGGRAAAEAPEIRRSFSTKRALIVDDSIVMRVILRKMLSGLGMEVLEVDGGRKALSVLEEGDPPELLFLDWSMPEMDGFALLREIRAREGWKNLKVVMVTGEERPESVEQALSAGADAFLTKPFTIQHLKDKLTSIK